MSTSRFLIAAAAGAVFGVWAVCLLLGFGDGGLRLDGYQNGQFVLGYLLMIYAPPIIVAGLSYLALRKSKHP